MHKDRDHYIMFLTVLPLILFITLYVAWRSTGQPPVSLPTISIPFITLPTLPDIGGYIPAFVTDAWTRIVSNGDTIFPAVGIGVIAGLVGFGVLNDVVRTGWRKLSPRLARRRSSTLDDESGETDVH